MLDRKSKLEPFPMEASPVENGTPEKCEAVPFVAKWGQSTGVASPKKACITTALIVHMTAFLWSALNLASAEQDQFGKEK